MKRTALTLLLIFMGSLAGAQSLTELAKKEKDRRKANQEAGKEAAVDVREGELGPREPTSEESSGEDDMEKRLGALDQALTDVEKDLDRARKRREEAVEECAVARGRGEGWDSRPCREAKELYAEINKLKRERHELARKFGAKKN